MSRRTLAPSCSDALHTRASRHVAREEAKVAEFLLIELRRANRTILRLREVALAARDGDAERVRAALARLHAADLHPRRRT